MRCSCLNCCRILLIMCLMLIWLKIVCFVVYLNLCWMKSCGKFCVIRVLNCIWCCFFMLKWLRWMGLCRKRKILISVWFLVIIWKLLLILGWYWKYWLIWLIWILFFSWVLEIELTKLVSWIICLGWLFLILVKLLVIMKWCSNASLIMRL